MSRKMRNVIIGYAIVMLSVSAGHAGQATTAEQLSNLLASLKNPDAKMTPIPGKRSKAQRIAQSQREECPVNSGLWCGDSVPYCYFCDNEYWCCWTSEVWRCCNN